MENYGEINAELNRKFAKGEYFDSSEVYVEDGYLCVGEGFFRLSGKEQDALIQYLCPEDDSTEEIKMNLLRKKDTGITAVARSRATPVLSLYSRETKRPDPFFARIRSFL